jgi:hypothetical protein
MANKPPAFPWIRGVQPTYRSFDIKVSVCQDNEGQVFSIHELAPEDEEICSTMHSRGLEQIAFGLVVESIRREVFLEVLLRQSKDEGFLERYSSGTDEVRDVILREIASETNRVMAKSIEATSYAATAEILEMILLGAAESS